MVEQRKLRGGANKGRGANRDEGGGRGPERKKVNTKRNLGGGGGGRRRGRK